MDPLSQENATVNTIGHATEQMNMPCELSFCEPTEKLSNDSIETHPPPSVPEHMMHNDPLQSPTLVTPLASAFPPMDTCLPYVSNFSVSQPSAAPDNTMVNNETGAAAANTTHLPTGPEHDLEERKPDKEHKKRSKNWTRPETLKLIKLRTELAPKFARTGRKSELWDQIASALKQDQFTRDAQQCRDKWEKLMAGYKEVKDGHKDREDYPFYEELHPLLSGKGLRKESRENTTLQQQDAEMHEAGDMAAASNTQQLPLPAYGMKEQESKGPFVRANGGGEEEEDEEEKLHRGESFGLSESYGYLLFHASCLFLGFPLHHNMRDGPVRHLHRPSPHHNKASCWPSPSKSFVSVSVITELESPGPSSSPLHLHINSTANPNSNRTTDSQQGEVPDINKPLRTRVRASTLPCSTEAQVASSEGMVVARRRSERLISNSHSRNHSHRESKPSDGRCLRSRLNCQASIISDAANKRLRKRQASTLTRVSSPAKRKSSSSSNSRTQRRKKPRSNGYLIGNHMNFDEGKDSPVNESSPASLESFNGEGTKVLELGVDGENSDGSPSSSSSIDSSGSSGSGEIVRARTVLCDQIRVGTVLSDETNERSLEEDNSPPASMEGDHSPLQINGSSVVTALVSELPDANFNEGGLGNDIISVQGGFEDGEGSHHGGCTEAQNNFVSIGKGRDDGEGSQLTRFDDETRDGELLAKGKRLMRKEGEIDEDASTVSHGGDFDEHQPYLPGLDDESALRCLAFLPLCEVGRLVGVNRQYRELVEKGVISELRHGYGLVEQWVFIYTSDPSGRWTAYSPKHNIWKTLPPVEVDQLFNMSDKESLSVGTQVLWLGREGFDFVYYRYDILTNLWEKGPPMANPRWLFAWATCDYHQFAFVAGGYGPGGPNGGLGGLRVLDTAERYNSLTGEWESLPSMSMPRQKCSGFFMDGKFYVIGGKDANHRQILSGEEYDPISKTWKVIEGMYFEPAVALPVESSPPLVAVVNNQLYAVDNTVNILKFYDKKMNKWIDLGYLPVRTDAHNGWGVAFKACGDRLFLMGDVDGITAFSWQPGPGAEAMVPNWQILSRQERLDNIFLLNCAVMVY